MIRSSTGAVICPNGKPGAGVLLSFPENPDKEGAQMSFVSQLTLANGKVLSGISSE
jgi:hypothetical protein